MISYITPIISSSEHKRGGKQYFLEWITDLARAWNLHSDIRQQRGLCDCECIRSSVMRRRKHDSDLWLHCGGDRESQWIDTHRLDLPSLRTLQAEIKSPSHRKLTHHSILLSQFRSWSQCYFNLRWEKQTKINWGWLLIKCCISSLKAIYKTISNY